MRYAIAVQRTFEARASAGEHGAVRVRIGLHTGEAIVDRAGDLFGRHVIIAARVANLADGREIPTSSLVREIVASRGDVVFDDGRDVTLKGIEGTHSVYAVDWRGSPV